MGELHKFLCQADTVALALHDSTVIHFSHDGIAASNTSRGHRFMANVTIPVMGCRDYRDKMLQAHVLVDPAVRREAVLSTIHDVASSIHPEARVDVDEDLVDTVTNLVEYPFGVCGSFDEKFLQVPADVLITSMRENQKYFPLRSPEGDLCFRALLPSITPV